MTNNDQKEISNLEYNNGNFPKDYKFLVQKLKSIKKIIDMLEKDLLEKEI